MASYSNPAARLFTIFKEGKSIPTHETCHAVWSKLLGAESQLSLMPRLAKVMALPDQIIADVTAASTSQGAALNHWSGQLNRGFMTQQLNGQWATFIDCIDEHSLNYLQLHSELLDAKTISKRIDLTELDSFRSKLSELIDEVGNCGLDPILKLRILRYLKTLDNSLFEYKIAGEIPILNAVESAIGGAYFDPVYAAFLREDTLGKKILNVLAGTANVVSIIVGAPQIGNLVIPLLPSFK
jgi:hypothetical protein